MGVPDRVWRQISLDLENKRLRRRLLWTQRTAVAAMLLLTLLGSWFWASRSQPIQDALISPTSISSDKQPSEPHSSQLTDFVPDSGSAHLFPDLRASMRTTPSRFTLSRFLISPKSISWAGIHPRSKSTHETTGTPFFQPSNYMSPILEPVNQLKVNPIILSEQNTKSNTKGSENGFGKWSIGGGLGPEFAMQSQTPVAVGRVDESPKTVLPKNPADAPRELTPAAAVHVGLNVSYEINDRFSVQSGMNFINRKSNTGHGLLENGKATLAETHFDASFLEIPFMAKWDLVQRKGWNGYVSTGASGTMLLGYDSFFEVEDQVAARTVSNLNDAFQFAQASALLAAGVDVKLGERLSLNVEPRARLGILTTPHAFSKANSISIAGISGIQYKF